MPRTKFPTQFVKFQNIAVDEQNPRQSPQDGQREAIRALIRQQGGKIVNLAIDVNTDGLSQGERFMVIEPDDKKKPYISVDGNRRLVALKVLENPSLADGILNASQMKALKKEADIFAKDPIDEVEIVIYPDREVGTPWVARRHASGLEGRGQDSWGNEEKIRFDAWRNDDDGTPEYQLLQFVRQHSSLTEDERQQLSKFPLTTLRRVVTTDLAKEKFGYKIIDGKIVTSIADDEFVKPFKRMMLDMTNPDTKKRVKVDSIKNRELQEKYFEKFTESDLPSTTAPAVNTHALGEKNQSATPAKKASSKSQNSSKESKQTTLERKKIIPKDCTLNITEQRIHDIYDELKKKLDSEVTRNACAVLMRVFIELSADDFLTRNSTIPISNSKNGDRLGASLGDKLWAIATYAADNSLLTPEQVEVVKEGTSKDNFLAPRVKSMHSYVHTAHTPLVGDLHAHWNNIESLMKVIWA
ncbi:hypothetical protein [Hymenobacter properus]|uniref:ParB/Sulfiredoxin domain-containing protein n=1 Tax=Hymenobacter properus TaxID=2791026 RepID=A0A931FPC6_9BACT|nr:hypothetical protein [Hymenobacter properus]MBF9143489.1 hypothetical protein [Hymenobacter properus]MBR7722302.1 hypothetical protein [Microvirga sp. SRT04]